MKSIVITLSFLFCCLICHSQTGASQVKLIRWNSESCDNSFDPYRLKSRISSIEHTDSTTIFTVHFSDNCCARFEPVISFSKNNLVLLPYRQYEGGYCSCNCCFSIRYEISGLAGKKYKLYFKESKVELTDNYYATVQPSYLVYQGQKINRSNKYGFKEGLWIEFYKNGNKKLVSEYPNQSLFYDSEPLWSKHYYESGKLFYYNRRDTSESWFEDGQLKYQFIKYQLGDTTFDRGFRIYENRQLQKMYLEKSYLIARKSELDPDYRDSAKITETVYAREYFENGQAKFQSVNDTTFFWFETGQVESKRYKSGELQFNREGVLIKQSFCWQTKGPKRWGNLSNSLYVQFYPNGNIKQIELVRDEPTDQGMAPGVRYRWAWNQQMDLVEQPEKWGEIFPWTGFPQLQLKPKMLVGLNNTMIPNQNNR